MSSSWKTYSLGELGIVVTGKTPSSKSPEHFGNYMPFVTPTDFSQYLKTINNAERYLSQSGVKILSKKILPENSVLVTCIGSQMGKVAINKVKVATNQQLNSLIPDNSVIDPDFLYYQIVSMQDTLRSLATGGSTMPIINKSDFENIEIKLPPLPEQKAIAEILSSLDDKIELSNRINKNLEAMAQAIFKQWFVDFEFPNENGEPYKSSGGKMVKSELGEIPEGWEVKPISNLFDFVIGGDWGSEKADEEHGTKVSVIRGTDIPTLESGYRSDIPLRYIKLTSFEKRKLQVGDIVIEISGGSKDQATGRTITITNEILSRLGNAAIPASFCRLIRPLSAETSTYLRLHLAKLYAEGGTWAYQNQSTGISNFQFKYFANNERLALPTNVNVLQMFHTIVDPVLQRINRNENLHLASLRDTLLPKLISGKLAISHELD